MSVLFQLAFARRRYYGLFLATLCSLLFFTFASQLEMCAIGVMANKGPSFFQLFGANDSSVNQRSRTEVVHFDQIARQWTEIDRDGKGYISRADASRYLTQRHQTNLVDRITSFLDRQFHANDSVKALACVLLGVALIKAIAMLLQRLFVRLVAIRVSKDLRQRYFQHLQALPMAFYQKYNIGTLCPRVVTDAVAVAESLNSFLVNFLQLPFALISTAALCIWISPHLSLLIFCGFPLIVYPILYIAKNIKRIVHKLQKNQENFSTVLIDFLAGVQTVKMFAMENYSLEKYSEQNDQMAKLETKVARYDVTSRPIIHTIAMLFLGFTMLYGLYVLQMEIPELFLFCGLLYIFYEPIKKFAEHNNLIQRGVAAAERMNEVLSLRPDTTFKDGTTSLLQFYEEICFDNVWFRYEEQWVLQGVSFKVRRGQKVAIVGPTGAGKSTIVQLLPRLYDVDKGRITIDGTPLQEYTRSSLREAISVVPQRPFFFVDTVAENIAFGRPFTREEVQHAARRAHAAEFIERMEEQYETLLAEAGKNLSGGQQQRLAIARALVKQAPILIMDEATSSLDNISEQHIKDAMHELKGELTQIVIAHRLSTIADADWIVYLDQGKILAEGTRSQLMESCASFRVLWELKEKAE